MLTEMQCRVARGQLSFVADSVAKLEDVKIPKRDVYLGMQILIAEMLLLDKELR